MAHDFEDVYRQLDLISTTTDVSTIEIQFAICIFKVMGHDEDIVEYGYRPIRVIKK